MTAIDKEKLMEILANTEFEYDGPGQAGRTPQQFSDDMKNMILSLFLDIVKEQPAVEE